MLTLSMSVFIYS